MSLIRTNTLTAREQLSQSLTTGSLASLVAAKKSQRETFLLIDCSYSMNQSASGFGGQSKMDRLRVSVDNLVKEGINPRMVGFGLTVDRSTEVGFIERVPSARGNTPLAPAIRFAKHYGAGHLIVVSDGEPDSGDDALMAASEFAGPIDVFYVGPAGGRGEMFLQQLAKASGGKCQSVSLGQPQQLTAGLKGLLGA